MFTLPASYVKALAGGLSSIVGYRWGLMNAVTGIQGKI
jgi:hypothetical protein